MKEMNISDPHYYSERLSRKLQLICCVPTAVIEAPSGYGKTTAVRDLLSSALLKETPVYWFAAADESPASGFRRLCREIDKIDSKVGQRLMRIDIPNAATVGEACDVLRSIECHHETYLVIDNFQYMQANLPKSFFTAMIEHGGESLHIVIITQMLTRDMLSAVSSRGVLHIIASDFRLDAEDIRRYYAFAGMDISTEDSKEIARYSEGWIIAVYLQLCVYRETGLLSDTSGIYILMERLVWNALTKEQKALLLRLSPFETVTVSQICAVLGCDTLPEYAYDALNIPFVQYSHGEKRYEMHSLLTEILIQKRKECGADFEHMCLLSAGDYFRDEGIADKALDFYVQAGEYERVLSLDLSGLIIENIGGVPFYKIALLIAQFSSNDIKKRHTLSMLQVAWALLTAGKHAEFDVLITELNEIIEESVSQDAKLLRGEWLLLSAWRCLPHLHEMTDLVRRAAPLFGGTCSRVILPSAPWCFGEYSQLAVFHRKPGEAD